MKDPFGVYLRMKAEKESAYNLYNYASMRLENAQIKERLAEIESQHEPLASLRKSQLSEREQLVAAAYYVVHGRMPVDLTQNGGERDEPCRKELTMSKPMECQRTKTNNIILWDSNGRAFVLFIDNKALPMPEYDRPTEDRLRKRVEELEEENPTLRAHHSDAEKAFDRFAEVQTRNEKLMAELDKALPMLREKIVEVQDLDIKNKNIEQELERVKRSIKPARDALILFKEMIESTGGVYELLIEQHRSWDSWEEMPNLESIIKALAGKE